MKLACISAEGRGETDRILAQTVALLEQNGMRTAGIVKVLEHDSTFANGCDMVVRVLPDGPEIKITQSLGEGSDACRLDPGAIAHAVSTVESTDLDGAEVFILNKFGPEEAAGRGFCAVIGKALERDIPVLVGVGASRENFDKFAAGLATDLPANPDAINAWCLAT